MHLNTRYICIHFFFLIWTFQTLLHLRFPPLFPFKIFHLWSTSTCSQCVGFCTFSVFKFFVLEPSLSSKPLFLARIVVIFIFLLSFTFIYRKVYHQSSHLTQYDRHFTSSSFFVYFSFLLTTYSHIPMQLFLFQLNKLAYYINIYFVS